MKASVADNAQTNMSNEEERAKLEYKEAHLRASIMSQLA
jgi:hypothetical protein